MDDDVKQPLIAAHRGGAGLWPENSLTAFKTVVRLPIDLIEFDVHRTADGVMVVMHDAMLERTSNGQGPIVAHTAAELKGLRLRADQSEPIPLLDEVIAVAAPTPVDLRLELKRQADGSRYPGIEKQVLDRLRDTGMLARTIITSFDWTMLVTVQDLATPRSIVGLLRVSDATTPNMLDRACREARAMGIGEVSFPMAQMTSARFDMACSVGLRCGAYAVNTRAQIQAAFQMGLAAFTTDRPDWAIDELRARLAGSAS